MILPCNCMSEESARNFLEGAGTCIICREPQKFPVLQLISHFLASIR